MARFGVIKMGRVKNLNKFCKNLCSRLPSSSTATAIIETVNVDSSVLGLLVSSNQHCPFSVLPPPPPPRLSLLAKLGLPILPIRPNNFAR